MERSPSSSRRNSLPLLRNEVSPGANSTNRRAESAVDVRTPAQSRLKRLQSNLKDAQVKKAPGNVPTSPSSRRNTAVAPIRKSLGNLRKTPSPVPVERSNHNSIISPPSSSPMSRLIAKAHKPDVVKPSSRFSSQSPVNPVMNQNNNPGLNISPSRPSTSVMNRLILKANRPENNKPSNRFSLPLPSSSPPKKNLKRRSDSNHNNLIDEGYMIKKNRIDVPPVPKWSPRKILIPKSRSNPEQKDIPMAESVPASFHYDNDIEMTEDVVQDEIASLRENFSIKNGYGLSVTVDESNKLVIKYSDYENSSDSSSLQKRDWTNPVDRDTALRIVVDTNILILGTEFVTQVMNKRFPNGLDYPIIVIPFVVLEELDKLKTQSNSISVSARKANNFLNEQFSAKNPQLQAQSAIDRQRKVVTTKFADDEILNCCLQVREDHHKVILLSNDVNLRNKALFTDIQAFSLNAIQAKDLELDFDNVL